MTEQRGETPSINLLKMLSGCGFALARDSSQRLLGPPTLLIRDFVSYARHIDAGDVVRRQRQSEVNLRSAD